MFKDKKQIVIIIAAMLMASAFVLLSYMPLQKELQDIKQIKTSQKQVIAKGKTDSEQMSLVHQQLSLLQNQLENYQIIIPAKRDLGAFIQQIADLMKQHNLKEQQITPGQEIQQNGLACIPLRIQCKGKLSEIFCFSQQLQGLDRHIRIETARFENDTLYSGYVNMDTDIVIYYRTNTERS